ncbi:hypothetical protein [Streptomyces sp. MST-110588]|uniref:hypothetical protein n=1 Tax=Streptomyces sp. MST-110588 TaxID=2833628 RepID=UPI001F5CAB40|nr:hypothetical protein [Streptomyces sp. MST-110588]UNO44427.1 hypothetical protein KGS77_14410 [Streptomyces sp. MST-110588]
MHDRARKDPLPERPAPPESGAGAEPDASRQAARPPAQPAAPSEHLTTTTERGSFCLARCVCGWSGPARRARSQARTDAEEHRAG